MEDKNLSSHNLNDNEALTPAELINKHNPNPKHLITNDEMKNLKVGANAKEEKELNREIKEKEDKDNSRHHENNPFDILGA